MIKTLEKLYEYIELVGNSKTGYVVSLFLSIYILSQAFHFDIITSINLFVLGIIIPGVRYKKEFQLWAKPKLESIGLGKLIRIADSEENPTAGSALPEIEKPKRKRPSRKKKSDIQPTEPV
jgi:hypothetical protein